MLKLVTTKQFEKDFGRMIKRGKDKGKLLNIMQMLLNEERLNESYKEIML